MAARIAELYETDIYAWTRMQAKALHGLIRDRWNGPLDLERLALEVEASGQEQRNALRSWVTRIVEHMLKLEHSPATDPRRGWMDEIIDVRSEIEGRLSPRSGATSGPAPAVPLSHCP